MLADVFAELGVALTPAIAEALYAGLVTDTGRFQYSNTTPKALRLAAELRRGGRDLQRVFQGVYESMQFAKLKLLARALERATLHEDGRVVVSYLLRDDFGEVGAVEPYSEGIIDVLRAVEGAELAALIREPPRDGGPARKISLRSSTERVDVSAIARKSGGGGHRQAAGFSSDLSIEEITAFIVSEFAALPGRARLSDRADAMAIPKGLDPTGVILVDKPAGPSSFAVLAGVRSRTRAKTGHAGTLDPFATGLLLLLSGRATTTGIMLRRASQALPHRRRSLASDDDGRSRGRAARRARAAQPRRSSRRALAALRGEVELPIPTASAVKIGGERAYRLHRKGVAVEMPLRRSRVDALDVIAYTDGIATLDLRVSSGTYVRSIADALGGHCVALRRTEVGPFSVAEADAERVIPTRGGARARRADARRGRGRADRQESQPIARPSRSRRRRSRARAGGRLRAAGRQAMGG